MRIHDDQSNELSYVYLALSDREAEQLIAYLSDLIESKGKKGEHWHLSEEPAYQREITIYREDDETAVF
jgi:hypothetical protein